MTIFSLIGAFVLYLVFRNTDFVVFFTEIKKTKFQWIIAAMLVGALGHWIRAARWTLMLKSMGYEARTYPGFLAVISGYLVNLAIPRAGEISRCALMSNVTNIPVQKLIGTVVTERVIDLVMTVLIIVLVLFIQFDLLFAFTDKNILTPLGSKLSVFYETILFYPIVIAFIAGVVLAWRFFSKKQKNMNRGENRIIIFLVGIFEGVKSVFQVKKPVLFVLETFGIWMSYLASTLCILQAFSFTQHEGLFTGLSVLLFSTIGVIVPAPGGVGSIWTTQNGLMEIYQYPEEQATLFATILFFTQVIGFVVMGIYALIHLSIMKSKINAETRI